MTTDKSYDIPGVKISRDQAIETDDPRDVFSRDQRAAAWDALEAAHEYNAARAQPYAHTMYAMSGDVGSGKSIIAASKAAEYYEQGLQVFSTASFGFGFRIEPEDLFLFGDTAPRGCVIFVDEAHSLVDRYTENSRRNRTLANSNALRRKIGVRLLLASVNEYMIAPSLMSHVQSILYPMEYRPPKFEYPDFCYRYSWVLGPHPFSGRRAGDKFGIPRQGGKTHKRRIVHPPHVLYHAAKLCNSWDKPDIMGGMNVDAKKLSASADENKNKGVSREEQMKMLTALAPYVREICERGRSIHYGALYTILEDIGFAAERNHVRLMARDRFAMSSNGYIKPEDIMIMYESR